MLQVYLVVEKSPGEHGPDSIVDILELIGENRKEIEDHVSKLNNSRTSSWENYFKLIGVKI